MTQTMYTVVIYILLASIYIYFDWGYSVTHVYSFTLVGPSLHLATLAELASRNDGRLDHVSCTVWRGPAIGVITLLREVCFNCYLLLTLSRCLHVGNWR